MKEPSSKTARLPIHYDMTGSGRDILCLSGFGCSNWLFEDMARELGDLGRFVMPDNRGMGLTPPAQEPYEIDDLADDALRLADDLGMDRFSIIGVSMGGFIAESIALRSPERLRGLVLMCSLGPGPDFLPLPINDEDQLRGFYNMPREELANVAVAKTTHPDLVEENPGLFAKIVDLRRRHLADVEQTLHQFHAVQRFLSQPLPLNRISCPTLVMSGADDRYVDPRNAALLASQIPNADLVFIERSDHLFFLEKPVDVHRRLRKFLGSLP